MYRPLQPGIQSKFKDTVIYSEKRSQSRTADTVYCFWELRTITTLSEDFVYLVLPDVCIDIVFDLSPTPTFDNALIMTPDVTASTVNLGREFSFIGIRFLPGTWDNTPQDIVGRKDYINTLAEYDMARFSRQLSETLNFPEKVILLEKLANACKDTGVIKANVRLQELLANFEQIHTVDDIAKISGFSRRHLQRIFKEEIGYSPHDFLKIIRFQQSFNQKSSHSYADQSHYIHQFKQITGITPKTFQRTYMSQIYNTKTPSRS